MGLFLYIYIYNILFIIFIYSFFDIFSSLEKVKEVILSKP